MRETFEQALQDNWDDLATHHAYADWLIDQGDSRGEFARCQLLLEDPSLSEQQRQVLKAREQELLKANRNKWVGNLIPKNPPQFQCRVEFRWPSACSVTGLKQCHQFLHRRRAKDRGVARDSLPARPGNRHGWSLRRPAQDGSAPRFPLQRVRVSQPFIGVSLLDLSPGPVAAPGQRPAAGRGSAG